MSTPTSKCGLARFFDRRRAVADVDDDAPDPLTLTDDDGNSIDTPTDINAWLRAVGLKPEQIDRHITIGPAPDDGDEAA